LGSNLIKSSGVGQLAAARLFETYSRMPIFRGINPPQVRDCCVMDSQSIAGILAAIIASVVLVVAFAYGPIGQFGKTAKPAVQQTAPAPPGPRGPVIRDVPN
jgi:hypothetical protein